MSDTTGRALLAAIAHRVMTERGLEPDFPPAAERQAAALPGPPAGQGTAVRDLRDRPWCSIDDDETRDLDQLTVSEPAPGGRRVLVAIADVETVVRMGTPLDDHARKNTTSVYTAGGIFPMLPERLSTDLTSLGADEDRLAVVVAYVVDGEGAVGGSEVFPARVRNQAKLAYDSVAAWLEGTAPPPAALARVPGMDAQIRAQDAAAQALRKRRHEQGALDLETIEAKVVLQGDDVVGLRVQPKNRARQLIEDFMIAANGVTARFLADRGRPVLRRLVRSPERWDRLEALAAETGDRLPPDPDPRALSEFLTRRRAADPLRFPDLSLSVVKLLGSGEYAVQRPGAEAEGHFGLAVRDYAHSTAPNRRYPDVITQRLVKAALADRPDPYSLPDLEALAAHCTVQEDAAAKVERQVRKSAAALVVSSRVGERFDAIVTGASEKGTWVRALDPPVEGRLVRGERGREVGQRLSVRLASTDVDRGYIDFEA